MPTAPSPTFEGSRHLHLHSIEKISGLPVISSTINLTQGLYGKVKESTTASKVIFELAEHSVQKAAQLAEPVAMTFEKPIKMADSVVCKSIDIVGSHIEKAREAPQKLTNVMTSTPVKPAMDYVKEVSSYGLQTVGYLCIKLGSPRAWTGEQAEPENESECEKTNEPEMHDCGTQTIGNVRNKVKLFSQH